MMTEQELRDLLARGEGETLDFKEAPYALDTRDKKARFIKDIISMANTPREEAAHIVIGVRKCPNGSFEVIGVAGHPDDADLQSQFTHRVFPVPTFRYEPVTIQGKSVGVIVIPPRRSGPCCPLRDFGNVLRQHVVYFRRGSCNDVADVSEQQRIHRWFGSDPSQSPPVPPCGYGPERPAGFDEPLVFLGRAEQVADLASHIKTFRPRVVILAGTAGVGKTTLANRVAGEVRDVFPAGVVPCDLRGSREASLSPHAAMRQVLVQLDPSGIPDNPEVLENRYRSTLRSKQVLILADDASGAEQVEKLVPPSGSLLLVTSRNSFALPGCKPAAVKRLAAADARELLLEMAGYDQPPRAS